MNYARKFLNHVTIFSAVMTTALVVANLMSDDMGNTVAGRKINKLESKLTKICEKV